MFAYSVEPTLLHMLYLILACFVTMAFHISSLLTYTHIVNRYLTFITSSMVVLGDKLGGGPADRLVGVLRIVSGALFSRKQ
jgi:hypothetical protein